MRFEALTLERYGGFERQVVTLDPRPGRLNLLVAPNGAGKSVLRRAFADFLFGIGGQSPMGFRFGYGGMKLSAALRDAGGGTVRLVRRKGHGATLVDGEGRDGAAALAGMLGGTDLRRLEQLFSLDTERLRTGGRELLETGGDLAEALLSAGSGLRRARELERGFAKARDELAPGRRSARLPFYRGLDGLAEARKAGRAATLTTEAWEGLQRGVAEAGEALGRAEAEAASLGVALARLSRIRATRPLLQRYDGAVAWLAEHGDAPVLPESLGGVLAGAREAVSRAEDRVGGLGATLLRHEEALAGIVPDRRPLDHAAGIEALAGEAATVRQSQADLPAQAAELAAAERQAGVLRDDLGLREGDAGLPGRPALAEAQSLLERHAALAVLLGEMPAALAGLERQRDGLAAELAALPEVRAPGAVEALVREVREGGDPARGLAGVSQVAVARRVEAETALALVPGWSGDRAGLAALRPELPSGYDRRHGVLVEALRTLDAAVREAGVLRDGASAIAADIDRLVAGEAPVEAEAIAAARGHRDRGWDLVARVAFGGGGSGGAEDAAEVALWAGGASLPAAYVRAVEAADRLADRQAREAGRLGQLVQERVRLGQARAAVLRAEQGVEAARAGVAAAQGAWREAVAPLGLGEGGTAADVREVLRLREAALVAAGLAEAAGAEEASLLAVHAGWAARLAGLLGRDAAGGVAALLAAAEQEVAAARAAATRRAELGGRLDLVVRQVAQDSERLVAAQGKRAEWVAEWERCLATLGRSRGEAPESVAVALGLYRELRVVLDRVEEKRGRVAGMRHRDTMFAERALALSALVAPELGGLMPLDVAGALAGRLREARALAASEVQMREVRDQAVQDHREALDALELARAALGRAVAATGGDGVAAAEALLLRAAERRGHEAARDAALAGLLEAGAGVATGLLREEAASVGPDVLEVEVAALEARQPVAIGAQSEAAAARQQRADEMARVLAEEGASAASAAAESAVALLGRSLEEALVQHAAALLLREGLRAVEAGGDNRLVARIGAVFSLVTGGRYPGLRVVGAEEKRPARLVAVEEGFAEEVVEVEALSEGTRDQLFLALRVAAIEAEVAAGPSPPFLVDDVLQSFDDRRAVAAMRALLPLSEGTQVIVLTHHRHLVDLVGALPEGAVHVCGFQEG